MLSITETRLDLLDEQTMSYPGNCTPLYVVARKVNDVGSIRQEAFIVGMQDHNKTTIPDKMIAVFESFGGMSHTIPGLDDLNRLSFIGSYEKLGSGFMVNVFEVLPEAEFTEKKEDE